METVHIDTTQNVALQYNVATIVDRGLAVVIDALILFGYTIGLLMLFNNLHLDPPQWVRIILFGFP